MSGEGAKTVLRGGLAVATRSKHPVGELGQPQTTLFAPSLLTPRPYPNIPFYYINLATNAKVKYHAKTHCGFIPRLAQ